MDVVEVLPISASFPAYGMAANSRGELTELTQLTVFTNIVFLRIDEVNVAKGTWTVRLQLDMYWDKGTCQTNSTIA